MKQSSYIIVLALVLIVCSITYTLVVKQKLYSTSHSDAFFFVDEKNNVIDHKNVEELEQELAKRHIQPEDSVLELGARYGTVSCTINRKLLDKKNHVCVEPDEKVWGALEKNKKRNGGEFTIVKGFVSKKQMELSNDSYGSSSKETEHSTIPSYPFEEIQEKAAPFTVLIADCEGCLGPFMEEHPFLYTTLRMIQFERDQPHMCNYDTIIERLKEHNFRMIDSLPLKDVHPYFQQVWVKV